MKNFAELQARQVFLPDDELSNFRSDLHSTKLWGDSFWRRRERHKTREDPEIKYLEQFPVMNVLEIGSAYGRFSFKALPLLHKSTKYTGIEVCNHFDPYLKRYAKQFSQFSNFTVIFDNFFKTEKLAEEIFDRVILPMNTFPNLPFSALSSFLNKVHRVLSDEGKFIFSTHKMPRTIDHRYIQAKLHRPRSGEVLLDEKSSDRIIMEYIPLFLGGTEYGASEKYCLLFNRLDSKYSVIERAIFWSQTEFYTETFLDRFLTSRGFKILDKSDESHSRIYILGKS